MTTPSHCSRLERITREIHDKLNDPGIEYGFGRKSLTEHAERRRIIYVRDGGIVAPPKQPIGDVDRYRIKICRSRVESVEAHVYGENDEDADDILDALIASVCAKIPDAKISKYDAISEEKSEAGHALRTYKYLLRFEMWLPVPSEIKELRTVTAVADVCGTLDANGEVVPQP